VQGNNRDKVTLVTLGPSETLHERAETEDMRFHDVDNFETGFIGDFLDALAGIGERGRAFLNQRSAHPKVHQITERYRNEAFVVDAFIDPTKAPAVLSRRRVEGPGTLCLDPAAAGCIDLSTWEIDTTWVGYGTEKQFRGLVIGIPSAELFRPRSVSAAS
jgi:hypothetical protein